MIPQIPSGATDFSFKNFGIWRLTIVQQNTDAAYASDVTIRIVSSQEGNS